MANILSAQRTTLNAALRAVDAHEWKEVPTSPKFSQKDALPSLTLTCGSDVVCEPIRWLWEGYLALGKVHILGGSPGTGKTTLALSLAATITNGAPWPDGSKSEKGHVVIWSGEDDPGDTLVPRLKAAGADLSQVHFVGSVVEGNDARAFDPSKDMPALEYAVARLSGVKLIVLDPVVGAVAGDSHKNTEVRRGLQPLVELAQMSDCSLLGITHFSKGTAGRDPTERITGSVAFTAVARVVLVAAKQQQRGEGDSDPPRVFVKTKCNIASDEGGFEYTLEQVAINREGNHFASKITWGNALEGNARSILAVAEGVDDDAENEGDRSDAEQFLKAVLANGPMAVSDVKAQAKEAGLAWRTVQRWSKRLGVRSQKMGLSKSWHWVPPWPEEAGESAKMPKCQGANGDNVLLSNASALITSDEGEVF
jgi:putative DNA primase/helicase